METECINLDELRNIFPSCDSMRHSEVNAISSTPHCNEVTKPEEYNSNHVRPFRTLWWLSGHTGSDMSNIRAYLRPVSEGTNENQEEKANVEI